MPKGYPRGECRVCDRPESEAGPLSARGKCADCGNRRLLENNAAMRTHRGPFFDNWKRRTLAAFGVTLVDNGRDEA